LLLVTGPFQARETRLTARELNNVSAAELSRKIEPRILLDCYYNNEWKVNPAGKHMRYHYVWDDTTDSGFSQLAGIIAQIGCTVDTLCHAPTADALAPASIYIIVDPDTPKENPDPRYIEKQDIDIIANWVNAGGILILLGNDKGNAEFEHLNRLAARFGIHFNEDSRNKVTGQQYETGTFGKFPDHPLFKGVKKIFMKELSTLEIHSPATALLSDSSDCIIAYAHVGRGAVFAVGDPWFYNEYMDQRRLPAGFDNARAAGNLFRWLMHERTHSPDGKKR
jgi:unsaturated rhamnogalacturonyl hydrolase